MNAIFRQDRFHRINIQLRLWDLQTSMTREFSGRCNINVETVYILKKFITKVCKFTPPLSFLRKTMLGGDLLSRKPNPSNSCSISLLCCKGLSTSNTIKIKLHVRATAITCLPLPFPSLAPSMIPGRSRSCNKSKCIGHTQWQTLDITAHFRNGMDQ